MRYNLRTLVAMTAVGPPVLAALWFGDLGSALLIGGVSYIFLHEWLSDTPPAKRV